MILIPSSVEVEFAAGGFGLIGAAQSDADQGRLRPIGQILPDVLARYGIAAESAVQQKRSASPDAEMS